jgi:hypothetical protein
MACGKFFEGDNGRTARFWENGELIECGNP